MQRTRMAAVLAGAGIAIAATGCGKQRASGSPADPLVNTGLGSAAPEAQIPPVAPAYDDAKMQLLAQEAINLQAMLAEMKPEPTSEAPAEPPTGPIEAAAITPEAPPALPPAPAAAALPETAITGAPQVRTLSERIDETAVALLDLLRQQAATDEDPTRAYLAMAAMEFLQPGSLQTIITPATTDGATVSPEDQASIESLHRLLVGLARDSDGKSLQDRIAEHAGELTASLPMRIRNVQLCSEVTGFGQYVPLGPLTFVQGRPVRAVVYAEIRNFDHRPVTDSDRTAAALAGRRSADTWAVDLSEELHVYHAADNLLAWKRPEQAVVETSRNKRHDFYLVQTITLPPTLTIGTYTLKVIIRDRTSGASDSANIAFSIVADPSLASGGR